MPARVKDTAWDFGPALALINERHYVDTGGPALEATDAEEDDTGKRQEKSKLGDFSELWKFLGQSPDLRSSASPSGSDEYLPSTADAGSLEDLHRHPISEGDVRKGQDPHERQEDTVIALRASNSSSEQPDTGAITLVVEKDGPQIIAEDETDTLKNEARSLAEQDAIPEDDTSVQALETTSEQENVLRLRALERKERKRLKKEKRKAERQANVERIAATNTIKEVELAMPTPVKMTSAPILLPKTPKRDTSPYRARDFYHKSYRQAASSSPEKDAEQIERERDVFKTPGKVPVKGTKVKREAVVASTPKQSASRSQLHTPIKAALTSQLVPQSAPTKPKFSLYPSAIPAPVNQVHFQGLTPGAYASPSTGVSGLSSLGQTPQAVIETTAPNHQPLLQALGFKMGVDRHLELFFKLMNLFPNDKKWLASPMQMSSNKTTAEGIHVFVDASNIIIGFYEELKRQLGLPHIRIQEFQMSFDSLALLMERRRPVAKRILVGSKPEVPPFETARQIGYRVDVLDKVHKARELTERQKFFAQQDMARVEARARRRSTGGNGNSGSETTAGLLPPEEKRWVEQGVDEILHLKMLESLVDAEQPSTIVLATGDAAEAEYSAGFKKMVERALDKGWKVELVSWSKQISNAYRKPAFQKAWAGNGQFQILELDRFVKDLLDA